MAKSKPSKERRRRAPRPSGAAMSSQARSVLTLVFLFTFAFVAVIAMKLFQEWRTAQAEAESRESRYASFLSERVAARLSQTLGVIEGTAATIEADWAADGRADFFGYFETLSRRDDVLAVAVVDETGSVRGATTPRDGADLAAGLARRGDRDVWAAPLPSGDRAIFAASNAKLGARDAVVIARVAPQTGLISLSGGRDMALGDLDGFVLAHADSTALGATAAEVYAVNPRAVSELLNGGSSVVRGAQGRDLALAASKVSRSDLVVLMTGPLEIDRGAWRRTLVFYLLLLVAPLLVAVGLCAVLLMQMENIRVTRQALADSERRFRLAIEGARCGVWDWDVANDTVFMTDSLARMLGQRAAATLSGGQFLSLLRAEDQETVKRAIRSAAGSGEVDIEIRAANLPVWLHVRGRPWTGADGQPSGRIVGVGIDVTEQKGAQARVAAAETRLRAALETMSESFVLWDARKRLVMSNPKFRDYFRLDEDLVRPGNAYEMLELAAQGAIKAVHEGVEEQASELELADGRWLHLSERRTAEGGLVSIGTDITALKRQERQLIDNEKRLRSSIQELTKARERLVELAGKYEQEKIRAEEANRSKSEFLANMSHELRTPLNAINGFSEIMQQEMFGPLGDARYVEYVGDILDSGRHLLNLINDILDMSKIEAGKLKIAPETLHLDEIVEQSARLLRGKAKEGRLELVVETGDADTFEADPRAIKQVLLNILSNAIKFTPEGGRVTLSAVDRGDQIDFSVADTGIGISEVDLVRIGRPFEQIENHRSKKHHGSGLGLALSKSLVEMHGGSLTISSRVGEGTTVRFWIPRPLPERTEDDDHDDVHVEPVVNAVEELV